MDSNNLIAYKGEPINLDTDNCVMWPGQINNSGYGLKYSRTSATTKRAWLAHRYVWERLHGPIGDGMVIDHLCRKKACINPAHLEAVTTAENNARAAVIRRANSEARTYCVNGHVAVWYRKGKTRKLTCRLCEREKAARYRAKRKAVSTTPAM